MKALIALVALAVAAPASAAWRRVDSPNFIVIGDASVKELRATAAKFEAFHETLRRVLPAAATGTPVPTVVIVFPNDEAFTPFKPRSQGNSRAIAGYAAAGSDVNYIAMRGGDDIERVIFHEYTHLIVANSVARVPLWLNEGLADFYSTFDLMNDGTRARIGRPVDEHLQLLHGTLPLPLVDLLRVGSMSSLDNERVRAGDFYAESWALTHMLLNGTPRRAAELSDYLSRVSSGMGETQAWEAVFGTARTEKELRSYITRTVYSTVLIDFTQRVAALSATDVLLSSADTAAFLAMLQLRNLGADPAARLLAPALTADPANPLVGAAMAQIEIARGDATSAEERLANLAGIGEVSDWFAAYSAGVTLAGTVSWVPGTSESNEELATVLRWLDRVRRDRSELPNVLATLAKIEMLGGATPSADAYAQIARARTLAPGRVDYALTQAELFANARNFAAARAVLGPLMTPVYPENVRNAARRLMAGLVDLEKTISEQGGANRQGRFIPDFRRVEAGEARIEGMLERIDCPDGRPAVLHVRTTAGVIQLEGQMANVAFIAYRNDLTGGISCGSREPMRVYVTWREGAAPRREKVVVAVEFLPKE